MLPASGRSWPPISLSSVDLPEPLPPRMATTLPRGMSSERRRNICSSPNEKPRSRIWTALSAVATAFSDMGLLYPTMLIRILLALLPLSALAQSYPTQPVKLIVGFPPGGTTDVVGRLVANELSEQLAKPFVVENRPGASGTIGAGVVAKSTPDGHTLIVVPSTHGTARALYASLPYEESDFVAVGLVASTPYVFVIHPEVPVAKFGELITLLKANPGKYHYASTSPGTAQHLGGELVKRMASVDMVHVPYKGTGAVMADLLSGRV